MWRTRRHGHQHWHLVTVITMTLLGLKCIIGDTRGPQFMRSLYNYIPAATSSIKNSNKRGAKCTYETFPPISSITWPLMDMSHLPEPRVSSSLTRPSSNIGLAQRRQNNSLSSKYLISNQVKPGAARPAPSQCHSSETYFSSFFQWHHPNQRNLRWFWLSQR